MVKRVLFPVLAVAVLGAAFLWWYSVTPEEPPIFCKGCNVVFILADTLRADHLGSYGYARDTSPFIDAFARSSIQFLNVHSQASCTFPSVNSILTSQPTYRFLDPTTRPAIPANIRSLPEILAQNGYATAAVSASPIVRKTPSEHNPVGGFGRGFGVFDEACHWRESTCVTERARKQLTTLAEPFFLYVHYMDPHDPYQPLSQFRSRFAAPYEGAHDFVEGGDPNPIEKLIREKKVEATLAPQDFTHLVNLYDEEILSLDHGLRRLFESLQSQTLLQRTIVVLASDHGESFYEHGTVKHCYTVYDTETRVPLVIHLPPLATTPVVRESPVQNLDILPTLLDYLGLPMEGLEFAGRSLRPVIEKDQPNLPAFSSAGAWRSVNDERYKLIYHLGHKSYALYDLEMDPAEREDRLTEKRRDFRRLQQELRAWESKEIEGGQTDDRVKRAQELEEELRSLGYLG